MATQLLPGNNDIETLDELIARLVKMRETIKTGAVPVQLSVLVGPDRLSMVYEDRLISKHIDYLPEQGFVELYC